MKEIGYFNGAFVPLEEHCVSLQDRGYLFGDGVYEITRVAGGKPFAFSYHQDRLYRSMRMMDIPVRTPPDELVELHTVMIEQSEITDGYIYLQITRGTAPREYAYDRAALEPQMLMYIKPFPEDKRELYKGVKAITLPDERWYHCDINSLNLIPNLQAVQKAHQKKAYSAILFRDGICTEGAAENVFAVKDGILYTSPADHRILKGITRQMVITKAAPSCGITVLEKEFDKEFIQQADELFFTDTLGGIMPILTLDRKPVGNENPGSVTKRLQERFAGLLEEGMP